MEWEAKILNVKDYQDAGKISARILTLSVPKDFSFEPGRFVMIAHPLVKNKFNPSELRWGSMSISSSSLQKGSIELVVSAGEPEGISFFATNKRKKGDTLLLKGPFGSFGIREGYEELVFVASGTGIAPLIGMIRSRLESGEKKPITLFFGFKKTSLFLYREELEKLQKKFKNFRFFYITSRELGGNKKQGHVQELLGEFAFDKAKNTQFYLCGPPKAVPDISRALLEIGFSEAQIHFEQW